MHINKRRGITLIELLVVAFILAILAAAAVTTYYVYSARAKFSETASILGGLKDEVLVAYGATGSIPTTLRGISGSAGGSAGAFVVPGATTHLFYDNGSTWANQGAMIRVSVPSNIAQGIPDFAVSTDGTDGMHNSISIAFYENNGVINIYCGRWSDADDLYIPLAYLNQGCNSDNFINIVTGN